MVLEFTNNERLFTSDIQNIAMMNINATRSGCSVAEQAIPDMSVHVSSGTVFFSTTVTPVPAQDVVITTSDGSFDRIDLVVIDDTGTASAIAGVADGLIHTPVYDPLLYVVIARVYVATSVTEIYDADITDIRIINQGIGSFGKYVETVSSPSASVVVTHNLGDTHPVVYCYDASDKVVQPGDVTATDANNVTVAFSPNFTGTIDVFGGAGAGSGSNLTIQEGDSSPTVLNVSQIIVNNGTLTDNGGGSVTIDASKAGTYIHNQSSPNTIWTITHNLGQKYVNFTVYDGSDIAVTPNTAVATNTNTLTLTFAVAKSGNCVIKK
jgi:hypothetical protein